MLALKTDDTGEHQVIDPHAQPIDPELGGFRQAYELWVCHAQLPVVELTEHEWRLTQAHPLGELLGLRPRVDRLRELSHLTWHWVEAPPERQFQGDRYPRLEVRTSVANGVWFRPAHRVAGWVRDDSVPAETPVRTMAPVDNIGWYVTREAYRGERWLFATGDTPDLARQAIDQLVEAEVDLWRHVVAAVDTAQATLTTELPRQARDRGPEDGWLPETGRVVVTDLLEVQPGTRDPLDVERVGVTHDTGVIERAEPASGPYAELVRTPTGRAVVAWSASEPGRAGWRRLLADTRERVVAWVSRVQWRR